ncbi:alanine--tRNA ligase [Alphaproteobacteria bacterium]|nr:alanine--tRNA ligase [Alphaproteobacteria bacterium]
MPLNNKITVNSIRSKFIDYFSKNSHEVLSSSQLVPENDPTLLFTNAGMVQFKNTFTGVEQRNYKRAVTSQKCIRAGGKHNDLENVGKTARHHTFFEMLGNFSFGDYFKEEAIFYAWELLTKEFNIPKEKLLVTIYHTDIEAEKIWKKISGFSDDKIIKIKTNDNFWSMGDTGPCGPCSEIFYDHGASIFGGPPGSAEEDGDRFIEIWNLVFMQYEQLSINERINLPKPSIDTGMGLERISAVLQNTHNNYKTDMMENLVEASSKITGYDMSEENIVSHRVIADHLRSISFLIAEGIMPSNEGRGYVLRRIMRRAMRHTHLLGSKDPIIYKLVPFLNKEMGNAFPELNVGQSIIQNTIKEEELKFKDTLDRGMHLLKAEIDKKVTSGTLSGQKAFELYDTFGFPLDLTEDVLKSYGWTVDERGFEEAMKEQKNKARQSWSGSGDKTKSSNVLKSLLNIESTNFLGYEKNTLNTEIKFIINNQKIVDKIEIGNIAEVVFIDTIFYAESGGQISDTGIILNKKFKAKVLGSNKFKTGNEKTVFICLIEVLSGTLNVGDKVKQILDLDKRKQICSHHSATHLLHEALRLKLGPHVAQKGSLVSDEKLRFDFSHTKPISANLIKEIEDEVNYRIKCNENVITKTMSPSKAITNGAIALFGEKYGDEVRVVSIGETTDVNRIAWSVELCGGTHVKNTAEISVFKIISETGVSSGVRRIEAITNNSALKYFNREVEKVNDIVELLKTNKSQVVKKIEQLILDNKKLVNELKNFKKDNILPIDKVSNKENFNGIYFDYQILDELPIKELKSTAEDILKKNEGGIVCVISKIGGKASIVVAVDKKITNKINAVDLVNMVSITLGGKGGGGRPDMAQSGGSLPKKSELAIQKLRDFIKTKF